MVGKTVYVDSARVELKWQPAFSRGCRAGDAGSELERSYERRCETLAQFRPRLKIGIAIRWLFSVKVDDFALSSSQRIRWPRSQFPSHPPKVSPSAERDSLISSLRKFTRPLVIDSTVQSVESSSESVSIKSKSSKRSKVVVIEEERPLAIKVNNASLVELKNACDDAVKLVRSILCV